MAEQEKGLKKELSARQMAMVAVGGSIGTGLLLGSGAAIQVAGPAVVLSYVFSALIAWTVALALGEMSSVHPAAGSFGVYAELYLNRWAGFIARYGYWFSVVIAIGSEVVAAGTYMQVWFPHIPVVVWMVVFGIFLIAVNLFPVGDYGAFEYWFAMIKVVTIFIFILTGAALLLGGKVQPQYVSRGGFAPRGWLAPLMTTSFGLYSFLGIEMVAVSSGEGRSAREVSRATSFAFALLAFVYVCAMAVLVGVMPWQQAGVSQSPFVTVFSVAGIRSAGLIMNVVVLTAALSAANASLYVASRMLFSAARSGYAPQQLGNTQSAWRSNGRAAGFNAGNRGGNSSTIANHKRLSLHYQCIAGGRNDCLAGLAVGACALSPERQSRSACGYRLALTSWCSRIDSWIRGNSGLDCLHMVDLAIERSGKERWDLSRGAERGVSAGAQERCPSEGWHRC